MTLSTALCFALVVLALWAGKGRAWQPVLRGSLGWLLLVFGSAIFSQYITGVDLGLDLGSKQIPTGNNPYPGRMSGLTALGFMLCGLVLAGMHGVKRIWQGLAVQGLTVLVIGDGLLGLAGYIIPLSQFYADYAFGQMSIFSGIGFIATGIALWLNWRRLPWYAERHLIRRGEQHILLTGVLALAVAVCGAVLGSFLLLVSHVERLAADAQRELLEDQIVLFRLNIDARIARNRLITDRPGMLAELEQSIRRGGDAVVRDQLRATLEALLVHGYSGLEFSDVEGRSLVSAGRFLGPQAMAVKLHAADSATLMWQDGFVLRTETPVRLGGSTVALLKAEQPLPKMTQLFSESLSGQSQEVGLCVREQDQFLCFPQRLQPMPYRVPWMAELPMGRALEGKTGIMVGRDYRGLNVMAAHGPVGDTGLGMVVKVDTAELYLPLRQGMYLLLLLALAVVGLGGWLLHRGVGPLAKYLEESQERLQLAMEGSRIALWDWDLRTDMVYLSERWAEFIGERPRPMTIPMDKLRAMVHSDDLSLLLQHLRMVLKGSEPSYAVEHRILLPNGNQRWIRSLGKVAERDADGKVVRMVGTNADISRRKLAEEQLAHQASHDALTGLSNWLLFPDRLAQAMGRARRQKSLMAVLYMDIDRFKGINDTLGHQVGDELLRQFAARISASIRSTDTAARLGGDEFVVILEALGSRENGERVVAKVMEAMRPPFAAGSDTLRITTSIGMAFYDGDGDLDGDALVRQADEALYAAKTAGRNNIKVYA